MAGADYIVVTVEGVEQLELEADSEGRFTLSSLDSLIGVPTSGLRYMSQNSRYRGVRVENGELMRPYDGWQSEGRVYIVLAKNQQVSAESQAKLVEDESVMPAAGNRNPELLTTAITTLTKRQLQEKAKISLVARRALSQWNRMNTIIRKHVSVTKFEGTGSFVRSEGTTHEQAVTNQALRQTITCQQDVVSCYETFVMEDKGSQVVLDHIRAAEQVRGCVNNLKRPLKSVPSPPSSHVTPEAAKSTSHSSQPATTKQVSTPSRSQMELPLRAGTSRRTALSGSEGVELNGADCGEERSDYELQRSRSIRLNKEFLHSQQMIANVMDDDDAVLVAKKWWSRSHATKPSLISMVSAIDDAGLPRPKKNCTLREMMAHIGNRLVEEKRVTLKRTAGLSKEDIIL
eukprot:Em0003g1145a